MASRPLRLACWFGLAVGMVALDSLLGPLIQFPIFYLIPVALCAWFDGVAASLALAVGLPLVRLYLMSQWDFPLGVQTAVINAVIRMVVLSSLAVVVNRTARQTRLLAREVDVLEGLLPICAHCKKIRDENGEWQRLERYITQRSAAEFTHGICPGCCVTHYGGENMTPRP
jgi:hypothetical protein